MPVRHKPVWPNCLRRTLEQKKLVADQIACNGRTSVGIVDDIIGTNCSKVLVNRLRIRGEEVQIGTSSIIGKRNHCQQFIGNRADATSRNHIVWKLCPSDAARSACQWIEDRILRTRAEITPPERLDWHGSENIASGPHPDSLIVTKQKELVLDERPARAFLHIG